MTPAPKLTIVEVPVPVGTDRVRVVVDAEQVQSIQAYIKSGPEKVLRTDPTMSSQGWDLVADVGKADEGT